MWVDQADPGADAAKSIKEGNTKFVALYAYQIDIPGVSTEIYREAYMSNNYLGIEGTTDAPCSKEHKRVNRKARKYAAEYNQYLQRYLDAP